MFKTSIIKALRDRKLLVIIGNGFDLDLGLKTSYQEFMLSQIFEQNREKSHLETTSYGKLNLFDYLQDRFDGNDKKWIDVEIELREFAKNVDLSEYENIPEATEFIEHSFNQVRAALCEYLSKIDWPSINIHSVAIESLKAISSSRNCVIYNFNYTDIGRIYEYIGGTPSFSVYNIHGTLQEKSIVLGFEKTSLQYPDLDFMIKYQSDNYKTSKDNDIRKDLEEAEEILIFGHTLGCTDHSYFQKFFQREVAPNRVNRTPISIVTLNAKSRRLINREINHMTDGEADMLNINFIETHGNTSKEEILKFFNDLKARATPRQIPLKPRYFYY